MDIPSLCFWAASHHHSRVIIIQSFADADTRQLFVEETNERFAAIARVALRKLMQMNRAAHLSDLVVPPGNRLEALRGDREGFHSIRVNDQWRLVFRWTESGPADVGIVDSPLTSGQTRYVTAMNPPITPGEIQLKEYLNPMGISQNAMARAIGVPPRAINEIVLGKRSITPAMSIRFGALFGQSEGFWHGLQVECDFRALSKKRRQLTSRIRPARELAHA
jgi:addiction module HigA family antidote